MFLSRNVFVPWLRFLFVLAMSAILLFTGCKMDNDEIDEIIEEESSFIPVGFWDSGFDRYNITAGFLDYFMEGMEWEGDVWPPTILKGNITQAVNFSGTAGVLIIRVSEASANTVGMYTGVYYRDYTGSSIRLASAIGPAPNFLPVEAASLPAALSLFTVDNSSIHVIDWSIVSPYSSL